MLEQPWNDERLKMNGAFIGCVTADNAAEIMALQQDAIRYRWLREQHQFLGPGWHVRNQHNDPVGHYLDAAIDAARNTTHNAELTGRASEACECPR